MATLTWLLTLPLPSTNLCQNSFPSSALDADPQPFFSSGEEDNEEGGEEGREKEEKEYLEEGLREHRRSAWSGADEGAPERTAAAAEQRAGQQGGGMPELDCARGADEPAGLRSADLALASGDRLSDPMASGDLLSDPAISSPIRWLWRSPLLGLDDLCLSLG
ncbi:hypothetical protein SO802_010338 [Lithocarpus litseifolius]|uniref:Uncharacterized protein n=1 Tax=Lithocarpus litseifolius TaxID=425828 RepID=A0AAW2DID4_9ROSI